MTREELMTLFLEAKEESYLLELATGMGKTRLAIEKLSQWHKEGNKILIVVPKLVIIDSWKQEFEKWGYGNLLKDITFSSYAGFHKHWGIWEAVVFDEAHHLSDRCKGFMPAYNSKHFILLSATVKKDHRQYIQWYCNKNKISYRHISFNINDAIDNNILPEPTIILIPLELDNSKLNQLILKNAKKDSKNFFSISYTEKWKYRNYKGPLAIRCTQRQYYNDLSSLIDWWKQKADYSNVAKNTWLHKCGERLKWLSDQKESVVLEILKELKNFRTLTFCSTIKQSERLKEPCVNSKVGKENLNKFNSGKIKHITACAQLDEGVNLSKCRIGLFQILNSSSRITVQRSGRIFRHEKPVLIFPYYKNTREEEIIKDIVEDYKNIYVLKSIKEVVNTIKNK